MQNQPVIRVNPETGAVEEAQFAPITRETIEQDLQAAEHKLAEAKALEERVAADVEETKAQYDRGLEKLEHVTAQRISADEELAFQGGRAQAFDEALQVRGEVAGTDESETDTEDLAGDATDESAELEDDELEEDEEELLSAEPVNVPIRRRNEAAF